MNGPPRRTPESPDAHAALLQERSDHPARRVLPVYPRRATDKTPNAAELASQATASPLVVFAGGGTGGHLYPAVAVAEALRKRLPRARFLFFGTERYIDERALAGVQSDEGRPDLPLIKQSLPAVTVRPWRWPGMYRGFRDSSKQCRQRFRQDCPAVVVGTGGLGSVPAVREASRLGIPTAVLNPDAIPGRANRFLASSVNVVFVQWEEAVDQFPRSAAVKVCGCPVRGVFNQATREDGINRFGLLEHRRTLLVTGASQGARALNEAILANLDLLRSAPDWELLHVTGDRDFEDVLAGYRQRLTAPRIEPLPEHDGVRVHDDTLRATVVPFTDYMAEALAGCEVVVARAGASTLAETTAVGRASILMPYPHHKDLHQLANARCLVRASAARIVHDRIDVSRNGPALREALEQLMHDHDTRGAMADAARRLGNGQAAQHIAEALIALVAGEMRTSNHSRYKAKYPQAPANAL